MSKITEVRLTLAALIYGIEIDLKSTIRQQVVPYFSDLSFFQNEELINKVVERYTKENPGVDIYLNLEDSIDYLDFHDTFVILRKNDTFLTKESSTYLKSIFGALEELTPIRNRVMHTRPLLGGDFTTVYNFVSDLKQSNPIRWLITLETKNKIESDPTYVLTLTLPTLEYQKPEQIVVHNLPKPDFDETGFIGRKNDVEDIKKLIFSNKVVSIIGDGGIGKTALALKIAYDIVDMGKDSPFDLVIWTSAKTTMLTSKGIQEIYDAITNYTGLVDLISTTLEVEKTSTNKLEEILEYFSLFKTLLIIDNLETIQSEDVIEFIREAQMKCNIVITSRIGLGELEYRRKLKGFSDSESAKLIREIARIRDSETLLKLPQKTLIDISTKLYHNPLAIKWFVNTVEAGISPTEVLNNKEDLLNFCLTNVYDKLSTGAINILNTLRAARKSLRTAEIIYLSELKPIEVRKHLLELFKTTLISTEIIDGENIEETNYFISDFAKDYLTKNYTIDIAFIKNISAKLRELTLSASQLKKINSYNIFEINAITYRNSNEKIAAKFLQEALGLSWKKEYENALIKVNEARNIVPSHFESYRVGAFIKATSGDLLGAEDDYQLGLEVEPDNHKLLYFYSQFLLFQMEDPDNALIQAEKLFEYKSDNPSVSFLFVRIYNRKREYNKAIHKLKGLLENQLDSKSERIAYTELISLYNHMGQSFATIERDFDNSVRHFKKAISVYYECSEKKILDPKMIKNFCEALLSCFQLVPLTTLQDEQSYFKEVITNNNTKIGLTLLKPKIIHRYSEKFDDYTLSSLLEEFNPDDNALKHMGTISRNQNNASKPFVFIQKEDKTSFYANMYDFLDVENRTEWKKIKNGQLVSFEIGTNPQGECAKNIKLIE
ncbi:NB-ARC domain-containing protein [Cellulophaga fucicola]|uniref:NB-ARC domain-containing protein n=1 Tax=Cellulophaga fucicola TaxID=76595 RepID=A0A1K1QJH7_9FLAO|nr:NB-ARC domain-containing protein [Cellulophaga fucicola]SFW60096.1 NB-ARC domain-containing protein [Cellulophaga fucicola]